MSLNHFFYRIFRVLALTALMLCVISPCVALASQTGSSIPAKSLDEITLIQKLADTQYKGRVPGSPEYAMASSLIKQQFIDLGIAPFGKDYLMAYKTNFASFVDKPVLTVDGKQQTVIKDFKPHGMSSSGTVKSNRLVYVGYGYPEDIAGIQIKGQVVLMDANVKKGQSLGVADRMALLKQQGAEAVLMLPTDYYPIESFERPLNGSDSGIVSVYVRRNLFDTANMKLGDTLSKQLEIQVSIDRKSNVDAQNIVGFIPGKDPFRTLIISATLDGLGSIPNTAVFGSASMNASGVAGVLSIAKYYKEHQPATNLLFAVIGSETTNRDGIKQFIQDYSAVSSAKIIGFFNLYDLGGRKQLQKLYATATSQSPIVPYLKMSNGIAFTEDGVSELYNFNNPSFESMGIPNAFFRGADSIDSIKDTADAIQVSSLKQNIETITNIVDQYINDSHQAIYVKPSSVQVDSQGMVYVPEVGHKMSFFSTRYFDVYYESDRWLNPDGLKAKLDQVYESISWWNYYPQDSERIKVYYTNSYEDNWATAHRTPEPQNKTSGALQSPDNHSISVIYLPNTKQNMAESISSIYHELNHNLATYKLKALGYGNWFNTEVQEIQGHADIYETKEEGYRFLTYSLSSTLQKPLVDISWDKYTSALEAGKELDSTYNQTASMIFFLYCKYSEDKGREFAYRMYTENNMPIKDLVEETVGVPFQKVVQQWYDWYHGKEVTIPPFKTTAYAPPVSTQQNGNAGTNSNGTNSSGLKYKGDFVWMNRKMSPDLNISSITALKEGTDIVFSISYTSTKKRSLLLFVPPENEIIRMNDAIKFGTNVLTFHVPIKKLKNLNQLALNLFDKNQNNFMVVDLAELDKLMN
jgi:hypothetical protein